MLQSASVVRVQKLIACFCCRVLCCLLVQHLSRSLLPPLLLFGWLTLDSGQINLSAHQVKAGLSHILCFFLMVSFMFSSVVYVGWIELQCLNKMCYIKSKFMTIHRGQKAVKRRKSLPYLGCLTRKPATNEAFLLLAQGKERKWGHPRTT